MPEKETVPLVTSASASAPLAEVEPIAAPRGDLVAIPASTAGPSWPPMSVAGLVYVALLLLAGVSFILVVWPHGTGVPTWASAMSDELRFLSICAAGGALGSVYRTSAGLTRLEDAAPAQPSPAIRFVLNPLLAVQLAAVVFLLLRSFVLLSTTPVTALSPFGVLILGLVAGYASDSVFPAVLSRANPNLAKLDGVGARLDVIANAVGAATLDNYRGRICAEIVDERQRVIYERTGEGDRRGWRLEAGEAYRLVAWFEPPAGEPGTSEVISISGGNDVKQVTFTVAADSNAQLGFAPGRQVCTFAPQGRSERAEFAFTAPSGTAPFTLWLRVTQKGRLSAVLSLDVVPFDQS